jgi:hypothetical protein
MREPSRALPRRRALCTNWKKPRQSGITHLCGALPGSPDGGTEAALRQLWHLSYREASTFAVADAFRAITLAFVAAALLVPLTRRTAAPAQTGAGAH